METRNATPPQTTQSRLPWLAWSLVATVDIIAVLAWGQSFGWKFSLLNVYLLFPILGLVAYSTMWSHYIMDFLKNVTQTSTEVLKPYFAVTGWLVLALICLHPGLLILQRFLDGYGLPPGSYESYVAPGLGWITVLGSASLLVFLAYELRRRYKTRSWWKYITYLDDAAMLAIFYHGLRLGSQLQSGWFRYFWFLYGASLIGVLAYKYASKLQRHLPPRKTA